MRGWILEERITLKKNIFKSLWRWRPTPVVTFSLVSLLVTVITAGAMAVYMQQEMEQLALRQAAEGAAEQVDLFLKPTLETADLSSPLTAARYQEIADLMGKILSDQHIVRVKIWNKSGLLIYSDEKELVGRYFPINEDLQQALDGQTVSSVSTLDKAENVLEKSQFGSELLEIYVPLRIHNSPQIVGSYEIYHDLAIVAPRIAATKDFIWVSIALGFSFLYGVLVIVVYGVSRRLAYSNSENARLYEETKQQLAERKKAEEALQKSEKMLEQRVKERTEILADAFEFSQEIVSHPNFANLVDSVTQRAKNLMHAKYVNLCMFTPDMKRLELISKRDKNAATGEYPPLLQSQLPANIMPAGMDNVTAQVDEICENHQFHISDICLSVPLHNGGFNMGALCVVRDQSLPFTDVEKHTLTLLANSAAVAIANIRLLDDSRKQAEVNATLSERQRLTSELHDEAAQTLGLLNLKVSALDDQLIDREEEVASELKQFKLLAERAQAQMRMAFSGMNSAYNQKVNDLHKELAEYAEEFSKSNGLSVDLVIKDEASLTIPALIQKQVMYIYREALTNIGRYANAKKVQVQLEYQKDGLQIMVCDDGRGFDLNLSKGDHHLGLSVMQARAERVGGTLFIETAPGAGTKVIANIPIARTEATTKEMVN